MSSNAYNLLDEMKEIWGQTFEQLNNEGKTLAALITGRNHDRRCNGILQSQLNR